MTIKSVSVSILKWIVRPSIFNKTEGASNPFHDAIKLLKSAKAINDNESIESLTRAGVVKRKHRELAKAMSIIPEQERLNASSVQNALSVLIITLWGAGLFITYTPLLFDVKVDSPVINYIVEHFSFSFHMAAIIYTMIMFYTFISYRWRGSMFKNPLESVDFLTFLATPSKW